MSSGRVSPVWITLLSVPHPTPEYNRLRVLVVVSTLLSVGNKIGFTVNLSPYANGRLIHLAEMSGMSKSQVVESMLRGVPIDQLERPLFQLAPRSREADEPATDEP